MHFFFQEKFCMIRDKILLYKNYYDLNLKCYCCGYFNHIALECPMVHVKLSKERILMEYTKTETQKRDMKFTRKKKLKAKSLLLLKGNASENEKMLRSISNSQNPSYFSKSGNEYFFSDYEDSFLPMNEDNYSENIEICSIEKDIRDFGDPSNKDFDRYENSSANAYELISLNNIIERSTNFTLISQYKRENILSLANEEFNKNFDKKKDYEIYFIHNNSETVIKEFSKKQDISAKELSFIKMMQKRHQASNPASLDIIPLLSHQRNRQIETSPNIKIKAMEPVTPSGKIFNKKLRKEEHLKMFNKIIQSKEAISLPSKKIVKKGKWVCFSCKKKNKKPNNKEKNY